MEEVATAKVAATNIFRSRRRSFSSRWCAMLKEVARESFAWIVWSKGTRPLGSETSPSTPRFVRARKHHQQVENMYVRSGR